MSQMDQKELQDDPVTANVTINDEYYDFSFQVVEGCIVFTIEDAEIIRNIHFWNYVDSHFGVIRASAEGQVDYQHDQLFTVTDIQPSLETNDFRTGLVIKQGDTLMFLDDNPIVLNEGIGSIRQRISGFDFYVVPVFETTELSLVSAEYQETFWSTIQTRLNELYIRHQLEAPSDLSSEQEPEETEEAEPTREHDPLIKFGGFNLQGTENRFNTTYALNVGDVLKGFADIITINDSDFTSHVSDDWTFMAYRYDGQVYIELFSGGDAEQFWDYVDSRKPFIEHQV
jgi:hypothetical protein